MESESGAFLSGFCNYYSVISGEDDLAIQASGAMESVQNNWSVVSSPRTHEEVLQYLEYYEECPVDHSGLEIITIQALDTPGENTEEYFSSKVDEPSVTPIFLSDPPVSSVMDLDCLTDSCPFDWDLNLENLITTKSEALPDLSPICNEICGEYLEDIQEISSNHQKPLEMVSTKATFQCTYGHCRKIYAKAAHLRSHIRRHLGDKPYVCTWQNCSWRFNRSDELARHRRSHSGHKPYNCDYCPKRFSRSDHLTKHRKVHERKFASGKAKGVWRALPKAKPGRKPKALKQLEDLKCTDYIDNRN